MEEEEEVPGDGGGQAAFSARLPKDSLRDDSADLYGSPSPQAHQLLVEVYGDQLHQNYGTHLDRDMAADAIWKRRWRRLATQSTRWCATPPVVVGRRFTMNLVVEYQGGFDWSWKS